MVIEAMLKRLTLTLTLIPTLALAQPNACQVSAVVVVPPMAINGAFETAGRHFRIDPDLGRAITQVESGFDAGAISTKGAQGLMQLMPGTSEAMGVRDPSDSSQNVFGGMGYLRTLANDPRYRGKPRMVLVAYNAGPNRRTFPKESYNYADKVIATYWQFKLQSGVFKSRPSDWASYLQMPRCGEKSVTGPARLIMANGRVIPSRHYR